MRVFNLSCKSAYPLIIVVPLKKTNETCWTPNCTHFIDTSNCLYHSPKSILTLAIHFFLWHTQRTSLLLTNVFEKCETEMWVTHSSISGIIKQIGGWASRATLPESYYRYGVIGISLG